MSVPVSARARRRRTSSPPQGPPASRPVGGLRTLRSFVSAASRFRPRSGSRLRGKPTETTASAPFSDRMSVVCVGAKCRPEYRQCFATVITRFQPQCSASSPPPYAAPLLGRSVSLLLFLRKLRKKSKAPPLLGTPTACYTWPLFLHTSAGVNPAGSVPGIQDAAVPAAGADIVSLVCGQAAAQTAKDCAVPHASAVWPCTSIRLTVPVRVLPCTTLERRCHAHKVGRPGPGRGGRLPLTASVSSAAPGSLRSPFRGAPEPAAPTLLDRLPGHAPLRSAPYGTGRLAGGSRIEVRGNAGQVSRPDASACKTSSTIGQPGTHARASVRHPPASPARRPEKGYKYILREAAADAAAGAIMLA